MVFATRCPNPACKKFQLVEGSDRGKTIPCLICKQPIKIPADPAGTTPPAKAVPISGPRDQDVKLEM
ncbi:MAG: hypothetical protein U0798_06175 [Gemmataceae bacterium]